MVNTAKGGGSKMTQSHFFISDEEKMNMSLLFCSDPNCILADVFAVFPVALRRHCIRTSEVAGLMAVYAPERAVPEGLTRREYIDAVRYGGIYHDIAAYLVYNEYDRYPEVGYDLLSEQISENMIPAAMRRVVLEAVRDSRKEYDGEGSLSLHAAIIAVAGRLDMFLALPDTPRLAPEDGIEFIHENAEDFSPGVMRCFEAAKNDIAELYRLWEIVPPYWKANELKPARRVIARA